MPDDSPSRSEYWDEVSGIAQDAVREHPDDENDQMEYVQQTVDGHQWIIYTAYNEDVLRHTANYPDAREVQAMSGEDADWERQRTIAAFMAMENDALQELEEAREKAEEEKENLEEKVREAARADALEAWEAADPDPYYKAKIPTSPIPGHVAHFQDIAGEWKDDDDLWEAYEETYRETIEAKLEELEEKQENNGR